jgi:2-(1,2-epoxy-1,2-dihydrophenyl)acetyl-CoA isomerase
MNAADVPTQFEALLFERSGNVVHITLNRPDRLNALNEPLIKDLTNAAAVIEADPGIRAVLLTGAGRAFCAGADVTRGGIMDEPAAGSGRGANVGASMRDAFNPMVSAWYHLRVPVVVAVNGLAAGAGVSLALVGDIVLAARSATFAQLFAAKLGLMPDLGSTFHLPRLVGTARAKGLALLGDPLTADTAAAWGLIWAAVDDASLAAESAAILHRLANGATTAYAKIKAVFNEQLPRTLDEQLALEANLQAELADTEDFAEGVLAFRGKRAPQFKGR